MSDRDLADQFTDDVMNTLVRLRAENIGKPMPFSEVLATVAFWLTVFASVSREHEFAPLALAALMDQLEGRVEMFPSGGMEKAN